MIFLHLYNWVYNYLVANKRSPNKQIVALWLDADWVIALDTGRRRTQQDRSTFVREAISHRLSQLKIDHDRSKIQAPDRTGTLRPGSGRKPRAKSQEHAIDGQNQ